MRRYTLLLIITMTTPLLIKGQITSTPTSIAIGFEAGAIADDTLFVWDKSKGYMRSGYFDAASSNLSDVGDFSHSFGYANIASGESSFATNIGNEAIGKGSAVFGAGNKAIGIYSSVLGVQNEAHKAYETIVGQYSKVHTAPSTIPLFTVGNGAGGNRTNAFMVTHDDGVAIGDIYPDADLHLFHGDNHMENGLKIQNEVDTNYWRLWSDANGERLGLFHSSNPNIPVGNFNDDGTYMSTSDERRKTNITEIEYGLESVMLLSPKKYRFKHIEDLQKYNVGFLAQEVIKVIPEIVRHDQEEDQYHVNYDGFAVVAIKAIQELKEIIDKQQIEIEKLKEQAK